MDEQSVHGISRLQIVRRRVGRIQRQVYVQSIRFTRRIVCDPVESYPYDLPEFLPAGNALAIFGNPTGRLKFAL